ncbi:hypothetical protein CYLTODRAFT_420371 [Cylindrobasidium torrendii FP15055 ss-10]|uniref:HAD-like protein n=1 Tax=Cylindrobasidium torrendii FP15055 ss-10 TaxID=1314674 RepID=A0A0D7BGV5_9AGAR|nr:hypothetical protein CYLTODRAFT_420371 [Cylindrobasidium torrendii FP15055 ss-10]
MSADPINPVAPESTLPYPPLFKGKKFVVLSDWDGTITTKDSNDFMTDTLGMGVEGRRQLNHDILTEKDTFRDGFRKMMESVVANGHSYEECKEHLRANIQLDPGFLEFYNFCKANDIPIIIVSSGMEPTIRAVLSNLLPAEAAETIPIISNDAEYLDDTPEHKKWTIKYRHPSSGFGHDKSQSIIPYTSLPPDERPVTIFFGDGVSDMSAAKHADHLFVKLKSFGENDLAAYCTREGIPHRTFTDFSDVVPVVREMVEKAKSA